MPTVSNSVLIPPPQQSNSGLHPRSRANSLRSRSRPRSRSNSFNASHPTHHSQTSSLQDSLNSSPGVNTSSSANGLANEHQVNIPTNILSPVDTQAAQIRHLIGSAHAEKEHLQAQIKEARRASQRAEAGLRLEIESIKKAMDKAGVIDLRAKQKALALQEQVKQGWAGAEAAEKETIVVEDGMGTLENRLEAVKLEMGSVQGEWKVVKDREEEIRERDRKVRSEEEKKLADIVGKVDKLRGKKERKETEKNELEKRLEDLNKQKDEAERRNQEEKAARMSSGYYPSRWEEYGHEGHNRSLSAHPSLNNLSTHSQYSAGAAAYRSRGGGQSHQPRYASAAAGRSVPMQPSPTHPNSFYPVQHLNATSSNSPAFRPPQPASASPTPNPRGVNVAAVPFHPSTSYGSSSLGYEHTTSLMPPHLQHRIYPPAIRPRPTPNFHPPPSVLAEQALATSRSSPPAFPPLPSQSSLHQGGKSKTTPGPSLASIITRAVLSPNSALAVQSLRPTTSGTRPSPPPGGMRSPITTSPATATSSTSSSSLNVSSSLAPSTSTTPNHRASFGAASQTRGDEYSLLSPPTPWACMMPTPGSAASLAVGGGFGAADLAKAAAPSTGWGAGGRESSAYARGDAGPSRKGTGDSV